MEKKIEDIIMWWEHLTNTQRDELMGDYMWEGETKERHKKLREMYIKFHSHA